MASVLEEELSEREVYVKSLQDYQVKIQSDLVTLLQRLQWTPQHFLVDQESPRVTCSYCPNHKMPVELLKKHEEVCYLIRKKGYTIEELEKESPSSRFFYENSKIITIKLEKDIINSILDEHRRHTGGLLDLTSVTSSDRDVPQTTAASKIDFTPSERLVLYESVVKLAKESQRMQAMPEDSLLTVDFEALIKKTAKSKESGEPFSEAEKWAAMRDYKRRRQSYRAKNVHITKKTYTEIIREVIHNQVDLLQEVIMTEENISENKTVQKHDVSSSSSKSDKLDAERKGHKRNADTNTYKNQTASNSRKRDWESPDRKKRDTNKSDSRTRDQKNPDDRRRDRDRNNSPDSRKRDHRSPESRNRRSRRESPDQQRRNRSSPYSRKKDRKSPDARKRDQEDLDQRSTKIDLEESRKKYDRENLEGVVSLSHNKSPDHKRTVECEYIANNERKSLKENQELETVSSKVCQTKEDNIVVENEQRSGHHSMIEGFGEFSLKRLSSSEDNNNNDSDSHRHRQRHKKSKKHKKHKHRHEKSDK